MASGLGSVSSKPNDTPERDRALRRREKRWRRAKKSAELRASWAYARNFNYFDDETCDGMRELNRQLEGMEHHNSKSVRRTQAKAIAREAARRSMPANLENELWCPVSSELEVSDESDGTANIPRMPSAEAIAMRRLEEKWKMKSKRAKRRSKLSATRREAKKLEVVERIPRISEAEEFHSAEEDLGENENDTHIEAKAGETATGDNDNL